VRKGEVDDAPCAGVALLNGVERERRGVEGGIRFVIRWNDET
jgi:hypothetical protein